MASNKRTSLFAAATLCAALGLAAPAHAEPTAAQKETARTLMQTGDGKKKSGDLPGALRAYQGADKIMGVPTTALAVARTLAGFGQLVEAVDALARLRRYPQPENEPAAYATARGVAAKLEADLTRRIPTVKITVKGPAQETPVELTVDGAPVPSNVDVGVRVNPGRHVIKAEAPGYLAKSSSIRLAEGASEDITLELDVDPNFKKAHGPTPPPPPGGTSPNPTAPEQPEEDEFPTLLAVAAGGFALGGAGLIVGIATGAAALSQTSTLEEECGGTTCPTSRQAEHDSINTLANVSNVAFILGAIGAGVGLTALVLDMQSDDAGDDAPIALQPILGPGFVGLKGSF